MTTTNENELAELFAAFNVPQVEAGQCPVCGTEGTLLAFQGESFPLQAPGGYTQMVEGLSGLRCHECGEVFMDAQSSERFAEAGEALVTYARREEAKKLKAARIFLGMSQEAASVLTGGGHNAFQRYEAGLAVPVPAVKHLMGLLAKHPELGREIPGVVVVEVPLNAKRGVRTARYHLKIDKPKTPKPGSMASVGVGHLVAAQATKAPMKRGVRAVAKKTPR
ncbi:type II TA system antitoxin MqsA family protein [Xanthomonas citri]|uniref:type II TA system antitoxin MqsA family protein n=1 Tax=Xanthomonas citri TaxID=346 RepID=UPI00131E053F|nr:type II TA system antitoxin MqsA family protein [Xanthomonas citri]